MCTTTLAMEVAQILHHNSRRSCDQNNAAFSHPPNKSPLLGGQVFSAKHGSPVESKGHKGCCGRHEYKVPRVLQ